MNGVPPGYPQARPRRKPPRRPVRTLMPPPRHPQSSINGNIIFLGTYSGGKSTTINTLLGNREISPVENEEGTVSILEFMTHFEDGINMRIIDTPGLGASNSLQWDSQVIATLKKYLDTDDEFCNHIPHAVVIVAKYDDPKISHPNSSLIKCLKAVNTLNHRLFDKNSCNIVILLTRFMNGKKIERLNSQGKFNIIIDLVKTYTDFPQMPYIIFGENEAEDWELPIVNEKTKDGFYYGNASELPTGDIYPTNLIELLVRISGGSARGAVGPDFFRNIFQNRQDLYFWQRCSLPMVSFERSRCKSVYEALKECYSPHFTK